METKLLAIKASDIARSATSIIKILEESGHKDQEINAICLAASKIAESKVTIQAQTAMLAQTLASIVNSK